MTFTSPLTNFERFVLLEDQLAAPWNVFVRLQFDGQVDRASALRAIQVALARHPLLTSLVVERNRQLRWESAPAELVDVQWQVVQTSETYPEMPALDLHEEIGFRVYESVNAGASTIYFQLHHVCVDGKGAMQFVEDWLIAYERESGDATVQPEFPPLDKQLLTRRSSFGHSLWTRIKMIPQQSVGLLGAREFLMRRPQPILPDALSHTAQSQAAQPSGRQDVSVVVRQFDVDELAALAASAKCGGVTINDLLIRDVHLALYRWRLSKDVDDHQAWLRMMVPISLRSEFERKMSAANIVGAVFIDRRGSDCSDTAALLESVRQQMQVIKRYHLGFTFLWSLWMQGRMPGGLRGAVVGDECRNSTTLTNFGRAFEGLPLTYQNGFVTTGGLELRSVDVSGPVRPKNYAIFAVCTYAGRLAISLRYDSQAIDKASAESLIDMVAAAVRDSANEDIAATAG